ncbi:MAG: hypothetical protein ACE5HV_08815 [Acidobacteriota bacterium]
MTVPLDGGFLLLVLASAAFTLGHVVFEAGVGLHSPARFLPTIEKVFAKAALGFLAVSWLGILLGEVGLFGGGALTIAIAALAVVVALATWERQRLGLRRFVPDLDYSPAVLVLLVSIVLYFYPPPFEVYLDGRDQTVYQLSGIHLAQKGSISIQDPLVAELSPELKSYFFPGWDQPEGYKRSRYLGFYLENADKGRVVPQFLPLFPVWVGIGYLGGGLTGALSVSLFLALFSAMGLYYLGRRMTHSAVGIGAAVLLAGNFVQIWFARLGVAELAAQALVLVGCYGLAIQRRHGDAFFGLLCSIAFGLCWLAKVELIVLALPLAVLLVTDLCRMRVDKTAWWSLWAPLAVLALHTTVHAVGWARPYVSDLLLIVGVSPLTLMIGAVAATLALAVIIVLTRRWPDARRNRAHLFLQGASPGGRKFRWGLTAAILLVAGYATWWRPWIGYGWSARTMVELGWAISPTALALALLGTVLYLHDRQAQRGAGAILGILLAVAVLTLWKRLIIPYLFWAYRRFLPIVLPAALLLASYAWWRLWKEGPRWLEQAWEIIKVRRAGQVPSRSTFVHARRAIVFVLVALTAVRIGAASLRMTEHYQGHREMAGSLDFIMQLGRRLVPDSVLLFEPRAPVGLFRLEAPLALLTDHHVLRLLSPELDPARLQSFVRSQSQLGRTVYLLTSGHINYFAFPRAEPLEVRRFASKQLEERRDRLPESSNPINMSVGIYRLEPGGHNVELPGRLDVGELDDLYVRNFHGAEISPSGITYRWTGAKSGVWLPGLAPAAKELRLTLGGGWLEELGPPSVKLSLDDVALGSFTLTEGWVTYTVPLPANWQPPDDHPPFLAFESAVWRPSEVLGSTDTRRLGVKIDLIAWGQEQESKENEAGHTNSLP